MLIKLLKKLFSRTNEEHAYALALKNFKYVRDQFNELKIGDDINKPFSGDCEDFAFTLRRAIGGEVYRVRVRQGWHAVLVKDQFVYCNMRKRRIKQHRYPGTFYDIMQESNFTRG